MKESNIKSEIRHRRVIPTTCIYCGVNPPRTRECNNHCKNTGYKSGSCVYYAEERASRCTCKK